jgi:cytochrome b561
MPRTDRDSKRRVFDPTTRLLHWLSVGLILLVFVLAFSIDLASSSTSHTALLQLHRSFGITVWAVTLMRLVWRQVARYPNWPTDMPLPMRLAARGSEFALYALLLTQPILGLLQTNAQGDRADLFFLDQLPALVGEDRPLARQLLAVHEVVGFLLLGLIALHVSAAFFHHFWRRDDTLTAMLPFATVRRSIDHGASAISVLVPIDPSAAMCDPDLAHRLSQPGSATRTRTAPVGWARSDAAQWLLIGLHWFGRLFWGTNL